jgi:hypothetical protein
MKILFLLLFTFTISADDSSVQRFDQSCREFKELMISGNKLMFLRTNISAQEPTWKALICLNCNKQRESGLYRVTSLKDKSVDWHYNEKDYLALNEKLVSEDDLEKKKLGMQSILLSVRKTCRSTLAPINEGSHLELVGNEQCVRHEYLRQYLVRKYALDEMGYAEIESKKDLTPEEFFQGCHHILQKSEDKNFVKDTFASVYIAVKHFFGGGLGEFDPVVARDSKTLQRQIATDPKSK